MVIADRTIRAAIVKPTIRAAIVNFVCVISESLSTPGRIGLSLGTRVDARRALRHCRAVSLTRVGVIAALVALLSGCASSTSHAAAHSQVRVTAAGEIGPLQINRSSRTAVIAFAGRPTSETQGDEYAGSPRVDALFYGCRAPKGDLDPLPGCKAIFWIDLRSGKLAVFRTTESRYVGPHGVRVGTQTGTAERALHKKAGVGCGSTLSVDTKAAYLTLWFYGGRTRIVRHPHYFIHQVGGHVGELIVHSVKLNPGVIDCVDS
jgi:hypothetical protein